MCSQKPNHICTPLPSVILTSVAHYISYNMYTVSLTICVFVALQQSKVYFAAISFSIPIPSPHDRVSVTTAYTPKTYSPHLTSICLIRRFISPIYPLQPSSGSMRALPRCHCPFQPIEQARLNLVSGHNLTLLIVS